MGLNQELYFKRVKQVKTVKMEHGIAMNMNSDNNSHSQMHMKVVIVNFNYNS